MPLPDSDLSKIEEICDEDVEFVNSKNLHEKVDFLQLVDYLNIESLIQLFSASIAAYFRSKEFKEIKDDFQVDMEMTPEEEK